MKIYITDTEEIKELEIIDPETEIEWTRDLLGNYDAVTWDSEIELNTMTLDAYHWWKNWIDAKQRADWRVMVISDNLPNEWFEEFRAALAEGGYNDLEDEPGWIDQVCDEFEVRTV